MDGTRRVFYYDFMGRIIFIFVLFVILCESSSCNEESTASIKKSHKSQKNPILGIWRPLNDDDPDGICYEDDSVYYADKNEWFKYKLTDKMIVVHCYGSLDTIMYQMKGSDTLAYLHDDNKKYVYVRGGID